eukprot:4025006-Amphidinium_carterae.1
MAAIRKQLAAMEQKLGNKPAGTQQPSKGGGTGAHRGGGRSSQSKSAGWYCTHCKKYNKGFKPSCYNWEWARPQAEGLGKPVPPTTASALEKHAQEASGCGPGLSSPPSATAKGAPSCSAAKEGCPFTERQACTLLCADSLLGCQDGRTNKDRSGSDREQLKEELITTGQGVPAQAEGLGQPAPTSENLLTLMAFARSKAREGDQEAQRVYDQLTDTPEIQQMLVHVEQARPVEA